MQDEAHMNHVGLHSRTKESADMFFTDILRIPLNRTFDVPARLTEEIFGIKESVKVHVYEHHDTRFEVFISNNLPHQPGYNHICVDVESKTEFQRRCREYGLQPFVVMKGEKELMFVKDFSGNLFEIKER
jgi:catechol 2,3-dioxygenase-like lactoylglutathione lyase family enzyme